MEDEIERRGLEVAFFRALAIEVGGEKVARSLAGFQVGGDIEWEIITDSSDLMWRMFRATPEQRARACSAALRGS